MFLESYRLYICLYVYRKRVCDSRHFAGEESPECRQLSDRLAGRRRSDGRLPRDAPGRRLRGECCLLVHAAQTSIFIFTRCVQTGADLNRGSRRPRAALQCKHELFTHSNAVSARKTQKLKVKSGRNRTFPSSDMIIEYALHTHFDLSF